MLATNDDGSEAVLFGMPETCMATKLTADAVLRLCVLGLFPGPSHHCPPLWKADDVRTWVIAAAGAASVGRARRNERQKKRRRSN